jgi:hypothetical protein
MSIRQDNGLYRDTGVARRPPVRFDPPNWRKWGRWQMTFFLRVVQDEPLEGKGVEQLMQLQLLLEHNYVYINYDLRYALTLRGVAAQVEMIREGIMALSEAQQQVMKTLADGPTKLPAASGRAIKPLTDAGLIRKMASGQYELTLEGEKMAAKLLRTPAEAPLYPYTDEPVEERVNGRRLPAQPVQGPDVCPMPVTVVEDAPTAAAPSPECGQCVTGRALALIIQRHPEYAELVQALATLDKFTEGK